MPKPTSLHGWWTGTRPPRTGDDAIVAALHDLNRPFTLVDADGHFALAEDGSLRFGDGAEGSHPVIAHVPPSPIAGLGDASFLIAHGLRWPYVTGAMANGIGSAEIVIAMGRNGMLGFFGAAGLPLKAVEAGIDRISHELGALPWGMNLIHSPNEPELEAAVVELYLQRGVRLVEASAYIDLTLPVVRYRVHGIHRRPDGRVIAPNRVIAKVSRVEVAIRFLSPPPPAMLDALVRAGDITSEQARLAATLPMAADVTAEADSGGHTDNQPALTMLPSFLALRDRMQEQYLYAERPRVGAAGGIATPAAAAAAFAMGAAYVLTGSINQATREAGTSDLVRSMLAEARQGDVAMAPAADMFEMGVKVQVLKRGTMFAMRAQKLYDLYRSHASLESLPENERAALEKSVFRAPLTQVWHETQAFFAERDPRELVRAEADPRHKLALTFRWYLGQSSHWANSGEVSRKIDFQIWCGPAMGAFNEWVKGSFLEATSERDVVTIARNILAGAGVLLRLQALRAQGFEPPVAWQSLAPRRAAELAPFLET